ncbi:hypothetical protein HMPREF3150_01242 [Pseudomonas aeruginosa]|nr:hypothetical protein HMPREF3150_01242 [Pseudomonas aeruginosa]
MRQLDKDQQGALQQSAFRPLQQTAFQALQHSASLKGLLKPFKGKGELAQLAEQCEVLEQGLLELAQGLLAQVRRPPSLYCPPDSSSSAHPPVQPFFAGSTLHPGGWASGCGRKCCARTRPRNTCCKTSTRWSCSASPSTCRSA